MARVSVSDVSPLRQSSKAKFKGKTHKGSAQGQIYIIGKKIKLKGPMVPLKNML